MPFGLVGGPLVRNLRLQAGRFGLEDKHLVDTAARAQSGDGRERSKQRSGQRDSLQQQAAFARDFLMDFLVESVDIDFGFLGHRASSSGAVLRDSN